MIRSNWTSLNQKLTNGGLKAVAILTVLFGSLTRMIVTVLNVVNFNNRIQDGGSKLLDQLW